jgi:uridine phosphorylase
MMSAQNSGDSCLIDPRKGKREEPLPPSALLVFTSPDLDFLTRRFIGRAARSRKIYLADVYEIPLENTSVVVAGPVLGAPQAVLLLEKMIALGVREVIAVGWCGSLQPYIGIGDVVLPTSAVSEEGTSAHYPVEGAARPAAELIEPLLRSIVATGRNLFCGPVWTTDAPYRETVRKVADYRSRGVFAVDMETSALFTLAKFRGIRLACVLVVSDELSGGKWAHGFRETRFKEAREKVVKSAFEAVCASARALAGRDAASKLVKKFPLPPISGGEG